MCAHACVLLSTLATHSLLPTHPPAALAPKAKVLRDGSVQTIEAANLVPGDIVIIRLGDIVPADIKILSEEGSTGKPEDETPLQVGDGARAAEHGREKARLPASPGTQAWARRLLAEARPGASGGLLLSVVDLAGSMF